MAFEYPTVKYSGKINEVPLGLKKIMVGGQDAYSFHSFEGTFPHKPKIALDVWDFDPSEEWPAALVEVFQGVMNDPGAWAKKCVEYGADMVCLHLKSSDPNDKNTGAAEACEAVGKVVAAVDVPVIVMGVDNKDKDIETLSAVAEKFATSNLILGPLTDKTYKQIGAQAMAYNHTVIARSPIDVNLAKQLNILLLGLGIPKDKIIIDPTTGGLGYGMEYGYSVMERITMAALVQQDDNLQQPMISFFGEDIWKTKEANLPTDEHPELGGAPSRAIMMETTEAVAVLGAGVSILSMRHPESMKVVRQYYELAYDGGQVNESELPVVKMISAEAMDGLAAPAAKAEPEKKAEPAPAAEPEKKAEPAPAAEPEKKAESAPAAEPEKKAEKPAEDKKVTEEKAAEEKAAAEKAEAEKKAAEEKRAREEKADAIAQKVAAENAAREEKEMAERMAGLTSHAAGEEGEEVKMTPQKMDPEDLLYPVAAGIIRQLDRVHVRIPKF